MLWALFLLWLLAQLPTFVSLAQQNKIPIDFLAYRAAADAIERGDNHYLAPTESQRIWRTFHDNAGLCAGAKTRIISPSPT